MTEARNVQYWQSMSFRDYDRMAQWLTAIGFTEHAAYRDDADASVVHHSEWLWEGGGGLMCGSAREESPVSGPGHASAYLVTADPDGLFDRSVAAGASVERPMVDQDYGGRGGSVTDPEGNHWSFGSYQPQ